MSDYRRNHYVPQWYQHRFFQGHEKEKKFFYLDLSPERIKIPNGKYYTRKALLHWGPSNCFVEDDLYTTSFLEFESTEIEQYFFGKIDRDGHKSVDYWSSFKHPSVDYDAFHGIMAYLSSQKLRTPKGLAFLKSIFKGANKSQILIKLQEYHRMHCALWTECVWSIVDASESGIKFICTDHPVTVFNQACFPASKWCRGFNDPEIWLSGTHTIFPLSSNKCLILTNLSWARNPYGKPTDKRPHAELFRTAMFNFTTVQTGRFLNDQEVNTVNFILKNRANRYIAATNKEWLYPENNFKIPRWDKIGQSYLLMPDPRSMTFSSEILIGYGEGKADAFDEYGRKPWHKDYQDKEQHDYEWNTFHAFKGEYARLFGPKRRGLTFELSKLDQKIDDPDYHKYNLSLEGRCKHLMKKRTNKRVTKGSS